MDSEVEELKNMENKIEKLKKELIEIEGHLTHYDTEYKELEKELKENGFNNVEELDNHIEILQKEFIKLKSEIEKELKNGSR